MKMSTTRSGVVITLGMTLLLLTPAPAATATVGSKPPRATAVARALRSDGLPVSYPITDVTRVAKTSGVASAPYQSRRILTQAETATEDYDIEVTVYKSPQALREVQVFEARNLAKANLDPEAFPLMAETSCGQIRVELSDGYQTFDPASVIPAVQTSLATRFGPC